MRSTMKWQRPSPAMVVALVALFAAMAGTVYAGSKLSGKRIKPGSLPGNRIRKNSVTGRQVNEAKLGTVPSAATATNLVAPEPFHEVGAPGEPLFQNGAANQGDGFTTAGFMIDREGFVHLKGTIVSTNTVVFTLPAGYRPGQAQFAAAAVAGDASGNTQIDTDGEVHVFSPSAGTNRFGLDGVTFRAG